jgi:ribosomal-protein-alanine N-acetyltransferase
MSLTFRRMLEADMPAVHQIDHSSFSMPWPERSFRFEVTSNPAARCWVAELEEWWPLVI